MRRFLPALLFCLVVIVLSLITLVFFPRLSVVHANCDCMCGSMFSGGTQCFGNLEGSDNGCGGPCKCACGGGDGGGGGGGGEPPPQPSTCDKSYCSGCNADQNCNQFGDPDSCTNPGHAGGCSWEGNSCTGRFCGFDCARLGNAGECANCAGGVWNTVTGSNSTCSSTCSATCGGGSCTSQCGNSISCNNQSCCDPNAWGGCSPATGPGTQVNACGTSRNCCTNTSPDAPTLISPGNPGNTVLGSTTVNLSWNAISSWGDLCPAPTDQYLVYADTSVNPTTLRCTVSKDQSTACQVVGLLDQTNYNWKVVASNGALQTSSAVWNFNIKQPVISGTLYEDANKDVCWQNPGENVASIGTITVSANGSPCTKSTATTYNCVVPVSGSNSVVNLTSANFNPPYTAQTGCSTGTNSCGANNCSPSVSPGDTIAVNMGYTVKPWYQTNGCSVSSGGDVISNIPTNALNYDTGLPVSSYFVLNQAGVVSGAGTLDFGLSGQASSPNYQASAYATNLSQYKYSLLKQKMVNKIKSIGSGLTVNLTAGKLVDGGHSYDITDNSVWDINGSLDIIDDTSLNAINSVILVSGTITVSADFKPAGSSFAFVSAGNITVDPAVTQINGIYFTDANFSDGATVNQGLKVVGAVAAQNNINLQRNWTNTYKPTEYFVCDPSLYINLSPILGTPQINWTEVAP